MAPGQQGSRKDKKAQKDKEKEQKKGKDAAAERKAEKQKRVENKQQGTRSGNTTFEYFYSESNLTQVGRISGALELDFLA